MKWFSKKIVSVLLVGSLVVSSITGLSLNGFLGSNTAYASPDPVYDAAVARIVNLKNHVLPADLTIVNVVQAKLGTLTDVNLVKPITDKIDTHFVPLTNPRWLALAPDKILLLITKLSAIGFADSTGLDALRIDPDVRLVMDKLALLAANPTNTSSPTNPPEDLTPTDFVNFENAIETLVKAGAVAHLTESGLKTLIKTSTQTVLGNSTYKLSRIFNAIGINPVDVTTAFDNIEAVVDVTSVTSAPNGAAKKAILTAYVRTSVTVSYSAPSNSRTFTPSVTILDVNVPNSFLSISATSTTAILGTNGILILADGLTSGSAVITITLFGKEIYSGTVTLTYTAAGTVIGGGVNPSPSPTTVPTPTPTPAPIPTPAPAIVAEVAKELDKVLAAVPTPVPGQDAQSSQKEVTKAVEQAIEKQSQLDVSGSIKVTGDTAKVEINAAQFTELFKTVKENAAKLNDKITAFDPNAEKAKVTVTLDLGVQTSANAEIPITVDLVQKAKDAGIDSIAIKVNGVSLSVDVNQFLGATTLNISKKAATEATTATSFKVASDVYEFEFTHADNTNVTFTNPVTVKLPVASVEGLNTDLLVLAKIVDGKLEYYGGSYNAEGKYFEAERKSFSSYVIVENKVVFTDTSSVQAWAGKDIAIAAAKGIIQGRGEGVFAPNDKVTRAEFATMIVKTFHLEDATATSAFGDVKANDWFAAYVAAAAKAGLINGRTATSFEPNATISRAEMATISARALKSVKGYKNTADSSAALAKFNDAASINISLTEGVALASSQGIVVGNDSNFNPNGLSTRAEAAVVISRLLNK